MIESSMYDKFIARSVVNKGNASGLKKAMQKAENDGQVVIGFIGGSITQGSSARRMDKTYVSLVTKWWKKKFPRTEVKCINAGIGATNSTIGAHRVEEHLLRYEPDFVVIDFTVNDGGQTPKELIKDSYESLIRRIMLSSKNPGILLLFMVKEDCTNAQEVHQEIGMHYNLPMVSLKNAVNPELEEGKFQWAEIGADIVHPNDKGHSLVAGMITNLLEKVYVDLEQNEPFQTVSEIKKLSDCTFQKGVLYNSSNLIPATYGGWRTDNAIALSRGWKTTETGNPIVFEVYGKSVGILYKKFNTDNMGKVAVRVDGGTPVILDGYYPCDWGGYAHGEIITTSTKTKKHMLEVELIEESEDKEFVILAIMVS